MSKRIGGIPRSSFTGLKCFSVVKYAEKNSRYYTRSTYNEIQTMY